MAEPAQDLWLQRAERERWSRNELRRQLKADREIAVEAVARPPSLTVEIQVAVAQEHRWRQAAAAASQGLAEWVRDALDAAADSSVTPSDLLLDVAD
jgi:hypothetical protein